MKLIKRDKQIIQGGMFKAYLKQEDISQMTLFIKIKLKLLF